MENNTESFSVVPEFYLSKNEKVKELQNNCLDMHSEFDKKRQEKYSFHNSHHVSAAVKGAMILYEKAKQGDDIFGLQKDLERWNKMHNLKGDDAIKFEELADVLRLAFSFHDLGNIADIVDGKVVLREGGLYKAEGAEKKKY